MFVRVESQPFILPTPGTPRINWRIVAPIRNYQMNRVADISTNQIKKKILFDGKYIVHFKSKVDRTGRSDFLSVHYT